MIKIKARVDEEGRVELPLLKNFRGKNVNIIIMEEEFSDLVEASETSLGFWDNEVDDEIWNEA